MTAIVIFILILVVKRDYMPSATSRKNALYLVPIAQLISCFIAFFMYLMAVKGLEEHYRFYYGGNSDVLINFLNSALIPDEHNASVTLSDTKIYTIITSFMSLAVFIMTFYFMDKNKWQKILLLSSSVLTFIFAAACVFHSDYWMSYLIDHIFQNSGSVGFWARLLGFTGESAAIKSANSSASNVLYVGLILTAIQIRLLFMYKQAPKADVISDNKKIDLSDCIESAPVAPENVLSDNAKTTIVEKAKTEIKTIEKRDVGTTDIKKNGIYRYCFLIIMFFVVVFGGILAYNKYQENQFLDRISKSNDEQVNSKKQPDFSIEDAIEELGIEKSSIITTYSTEDKQIVVYKSGRQLKAHDFNNGKTYTYLDFKNSDNVKINGEWITPGSFKETFVKDNCLLFVYEMEQEYNQKGFFKLDVNNLNLNCLGCGYKIEKKNSDFILYTSKDAEKNDFNLIADYTMYQTSIRVFDANGNAINKYIKEGSVSYKGNEGSLTANLHLKIKKDGRASGYYLLSSGDKSSTYRFIGEVDVNGDVSGSAYNNEKKTLIELKLNAKGNQLNGVSNLQIFKEDDSSLDVQRKVTLVKSDVGNNNASTTTNTTTNKATNTVTPKTVPSKKDKSTDAVYVKTAKKASYPGGMSGLSKFLGTNLRYPESSLKKGEQGTVFVQFVIEKDGTISNPTVVRSVSPALDKEAVRVVKLMKGWIPAIGEDGKKVSSKLQIPIKFSIH